MSQKIPLQQWMQAHFDDLYGQSMIAVREVAEQQVAGGTAEASTDRIRRAFSHEFARRVKAGWEPPPKKHGRDE